ncbi:MAG: hypothetical protein OXG04_24240 [Acidobacteria bacterium]|nr:hypothetical protein [Acidobacteriota bacterium]
MSRFGPSRSVRLVARLALLLILAAPRVHAQDEADPDKERTDQWVADGGTVEFEPLWAARRGGPAPSR